MSRTLRTSAMALGLGAVLTLAACGGDDGGDDPFTEGGGDDGGSGSGELTVGGPQFTEAVILEEAYKAILENAGYTVSIKASETREIYAPLLEEGELDIVPEFAGSLTEYYNLADNGADADPVATADAAETIEVLKPLAEAHGVTILDPPADAMSQNGFAVSKEFADQNGIATLSDLGALGQPIVLAGSEECPDRPFCVPGLEETYGINITKVDPLGYGSPQSKKAVTDGDAQLALVATTDGALESEGLVLLEDDKGLQQAENVIAAVNSDVAADEGDTIADALKPFQETLTTDDLVDMYAKVVVERQQAPDVVKEYLESNDLL